LSSLGTGIVLEIILQVLFCVQMGVILLVGYSNGNFEYEQKTQEDDVYEPEALNDEH